MSGRQGGKVPYAKAPKKVVKELDEEELKFKQKQKEDAAKLKAAAEIAKQKGPMGGKGLKKSGK